MPNKQGTKTSPNLNQLPARTKEQAYAQDAKPGAASFMKNVENFSADPLTYLYNQFNTSNSFHKGWTSGMEDRWEKAPSGRTPSKQYNKVANIPTPGRMSGPVKNSLLKLGVQGTDVEALQKTLIAKGFNVPTHGKYDAATKAAVEQFQDFYNNNIRNDSRKPILKDGKVGRETMTALQDSREVNNRAYNQNTPDKWYGPLLDNPIDLIATVINGVGLYKGIKALPGLYKGIKALPGMYKGYKAAQAAKAAGQTAKVAAKEAPQVAGKLPSMAKVMEAEKAAASGVKPGFDAMFTDKLNKAAAAERAAQGEIKLLNSGESVAEAAAKKARAPRGPRAPKAKATAEAANAAAKSNLPARYQQIAKYEELAKFGGMEPYRAVAKTQQAARGARAAQLEQGAMRLNSGQKALPAAKRIPADWAKTGYAKGWITDAEIVSDAERVASLGMGSAQKMLGAGSSRLLSAGERAFEGGNIVRNGVITKAQATARVKPPTAKVGKVVKDARAFAGPNIYRGIPKFQTGGDWRDSVNNFMNSYDPNPAMQGLKTVGRTIGGLAAMASPGVTMPYQVMKNYMKGQNFNDAMGNGIDTSVQQAKDNLHMFGDYAPQWQDYKRNERPRTARRK